VFLLGSKTKMAPTKTVTIPRLELCASVLLARWMARIIKIFDGKLVIDGLYAWSDSQITLAWLMNPHISFKVFISNRVHQVHQLMPSCCWLYVRSAENPANCASRGIMPSELTAHSLYWSGPAFLKTPIETWNFSVTSVPVEQLPEFKAVTLIVQTTTDVEWFSRFSSYLNMIRVVAWIRRFMYLSRKKRSYPECFLTREELDESLLVIVKHSQRHWFSKLISDLSHDRCAARPLASLRPFLNSQNVICVGGRLLQSDLSDAERHPILLSKESYLSLLIARHWHLVTCHSGPRVITSLIMRQFWVLSIRSVIRKVIGQCTICVRTIARSPHPVMGNLPSSRVQACRPFSKVGVDYAGPLPMRECKLRKFRQYKIYVSVFVCMVTKAVHLEIVTELSTAAFLAGFDRFVSRRGLPSDVYSDCGTNFKGAAKHLFDVINDPANHHALSSHSFCTWHFNPPAAPHFGGLWEAAVRSFKTLLVRMVGNHTFTMEELSTLLCRIEAVLNSRPLTPLTTSPLDLDYLSPGHFIIGQPLLAVPDFAVSEERSNLLTRWKLLHQCHQSFWRRWSTEYLASLQIRSKWTTDVPNIKIGQMVVIKDNLSPPTSWRLGRILGVIPGQDGVVRVAKILTSTGELTRPVVKLVLLPTD